MRMILLITMVMLSACGQQPPANIVATNSGAAAETVQADINDPAANSAMPAPVTPGAAPSPAEPSRAGALPDDATPVVESPVAPDSSQGAANVVQTYYALIERGKYRQAWLLWGGRGAASGMSVTAFAASFARYRGYHATIGAPGREDAGAGQRYVTVPVEIHARLKTGAPVDLRGQVVLHRTGDIDGATAEQKQWRIRSIDLNPAATAEPN